MNQLESRVLRAQSDHQEIDRILSEYLPLIKKQASAMAGGGMEYDDMLSIAMLAFVHSIKQYDSNRGAFLTYVALNIRSRLIDAYRRNKRLTEQVIPLFREQNEEGAQQSPEVAASLSRYSMEREQAALAEEIQLFGAELQRFDIQFDELVSISPKQLRSRNQCLELARKVAGDHGMRSDFLKGARLPQTALAKAFGLSVKTVEKHRKYIVALILLLLGDYPGICTFLPANKEAR